MIIKENLLVYNILFNKKLKNLLDIVYYILIYNLKYNILFY